MRKIYGRNPEKVYNILDNVWFIVEEIAKMKRPIIPVLCILILMLSLSGCTKEDAHAVVAPVVADALGEQLEGIVRPAAEETETEPEIPVIDPAIRIQRGTRVAVVSQSVRGGFWATIENGMKQAVKDINEAYGLTKEDQIRLTFEGPDREGDVDTQTNILDAVIAENPDVLCLSVSDMHSCQAQLEAAKENGIPVVAFNSSVSEEGLVCAYRATNHFKAGQIAGYRLSLAMGKMGKVAIFTSQEKSQSTQDRIRGFRNMTDAYGDIEIVEIVYMENVENMEAAMQEVLASHLNLTGVFCTNAEISELYLNMKKDETLESVAMVGADASARQLEAVRKGEEVGIVSQNPFALGYQTIWAAVRAESSTPEELPETFLLKPMWIDASNIDEEGMQSYMY